MRSLVIFVAMSAMVVQIGTKCLEPECPKNEVFLRCQSSSCSDLPCYMSPPFVCTTDCVSKCFCKPGFERNKLKQCVPCPPFSQTCPPNEVWSDCISPCLSQYCNQTIIEDPALPCIQVCGGSGCVCLPGLRRNQKGVCVKC